METKKAFHYHVPTRIHFGAGKLNILHKQKIPGKRALILISNGTSAKTNGYLDRAIEQLKMANISIVIFDKIEANPLKSTVMDASKFGRENNCDFIVALGGGSVMDASKAIATMITNEGDLWDYAGGKTGKRFPIKNKPVPIIAITTTAGTGSEADQWGVITNPETNEKIGFGGLDEHFPVISIVDPELMKSVPPKFTAFQGFDALFHSTELIISQTANLMSDMFAMEAIRNVGKYLARAVKDGNDMEAREHVAFANTLSGIGMTIAVTTSEHSLEHAMSAYHQELPHGAGLIMISLAFHKYFVDAHVCDERFVEMAKALGKADADKPEDFLTALKELQEACGVADLKMSDYGITPDEFETMAINAKETMGGLFNSDRKQLTTEDCVKIYKDSYK